MLGPGRGSHICPSPCCRGISHWKMGGSPAIDMELPLKLLEVSRKITHFSLGFSMTETIHCGVHFWRPAERTWRCPHVSQPPGLYAEGRSTNEVKNKAPWWIYLQFMAMLVGKRLETSGCSKQKNYITGANYWTNKKWRCPTNSVISDTRNQLWLIGSYGIFNLE